MEEQAQWAVKPGTDEALEIAERIQGGEAATELSFGGESSVVITEDEQRTAFAKLHRWLMDGAAMAGGDHWECDEEEFRTVRDDVAPELIQYIPDRILYEIQRGSALGIYAQIILMKAWIEYRG